MESDWVVRGVLVLILIIGIYQLHKIGKKSKSYKLKQKELNKNKGKKILNISSKSFRDFKEQHKYTNMYLLLIHHLVMIIAIIISLVYYIDSEVLLFLIFGSFMIGLLIMNIFNYRFLYENKVIFYDNCFVSTDFSLTPGSRLPIIMPLKSYYNYKEDVENFNFIDNSLIIKIDGKNQRWNQEEVIKINNLTQEEINKIKNIINN